MKRRIILLAAISIVVILAITACGKSEDSKYEATQLKMDTVMTISAYGPNGKEAVDAAFKRIDEIEQMASISVSTSDVNKINNAAGKEFVKVHPEILKIIKSSIEYSKLSGGAFDITVGPIINLWNIGKDNARVPSPEEIKDKLSLVDFNKIKVNDAEGSVMLEKEGMSIDLGGIAKGFAADEAVKVLSSYGIKKGIINLGGSSIIAMGEKQKNTPWSIGLQHPRKEDGTDFLAVIKESNKTISSSGDYERYFIQDGKRYHHIFDPSTGYPADSGAIGDTIVVDMEKIKDSSMVTDMLSTVVFVLGPEKGLEFVNRIDGIEAIVTTTDYKLYYTKGLENKIESISEDFKDAQRR